MMHVLFAALAGAVLIQAAPAAALPPPPPLPAIAGTPSRLEAAILGRDAYRFAALFTPGATIAVNGKLAARGSAEIRGWAAAQFAKGFSAHTSAATIGVHDIWTMDDASFDHPGPGDPCCVHGRLTHYVHDGGVISAMEVFDDGGAQLYAPPPKFPD